MEVETRAQDIFDPQWESLVNEITNLIIEAVNLHHLNRSLIKADTPLGHEGLNLDSVDILEIVVTVEQRFKIKINDAELGRQVFKSVGSIADFVLKNRG